jgi:hypothetical protein
VAAPCAPRHCCAGRCVSSSSGRPFNGIVRHQLANVESATFLNLDLELRSRENLALLGAYLSERAHILYNAETPEGYLLTAEPLNGGMGQTPEMCTEELLRTLEALPKDLSALVRGSHTRVFDYGFDSGVSSPPLTVGIPPHHLSRMAQWDIALRVTVYPYRPELAEEGAGN